jgi:HD-GYP domain-containing protein (c-di-GMP phosphodiesterase class II)
MLAAIGSLWLARQLVEPINRVSGEIATMAAARDFGRTLDPTGTSRELDALTATFNDLMRGLGTAEAETRSAYLGAIRALAAALDARDPYTAGHSERVSTLSVMMGRVMHVPTDELEIPSRRAAARSARSASPTDPSQWNRHRRRVRTAQAPSTSARGSCGRCHS